MNLIETQKIDLLVFHADWCSSCQTMAPVLEEVREIYKDQINFVFIDADRHTSVVGSLQIRSIPTYIAFCERQELWRRAGLISNRELIEKLENLLNSYCK